MTAVVEFDHAPLVDPNLTLDELAAIANSASRNVDLFSAKMEDIFRESVHEAMRAGEALLAAKAKVPGGTWTAWLEQNVVFSSRTARMYMRIAFHRSDVEILLSDGENGSIRQAKRHLRYLPGVPEEPRKGAEVRQEAERLHARGMTTAGVAQTLGISWTTAAAWLDPEFRKKRLTSKRLADQKRRNAAKALARQEQAKEVKAAGGRVAEAYALLRRATQHLDAAIISSEDSEERSALQAAIRSAHHAEDAIVSALRIGRQQ